MWLPSPTGAAACARSNIIRPPPHRAAARRPAGGGRSPRAPDSWSGRDRIGADSLRRSVRAGRQAADWTSAGTRPCRPARTECCGGSLGPAGVGGNVTGSRALYQWQDLILDRFDPAGRLGPFGPVLFDNVDAVVTIMIGAAQVNRCGKTGEPQLRPARIRDVERL